MSRFYPASVFTTGELNRFTTATWVDFSEAKLHIGWIALFSVPNESIDLQMEGKWVLQHETQGNYVFDATKKAVLRTANYEK
jgi:hypothetical protein